MWERRSGEELSQDFGVDFVQIAAISERERERKMEERVQEEGNAEKKGMREEEDSD